MFWLRQKVIYTYFSLEETVDKEREKPLYYKTLSYQPSLGGGLRCIYFLFLGMISLAGHVSFV